MLEQNYKGFLLASHPKREDQLFKKSVVLIVEHDITGAIGIQINRPFKMGPTVSTVMQNVGIESDLDGDLFHGGIESSNRVTVLHTLDWIGPTTKKLTESIGMTNDLSVLASLARDESTPENYRIVAGCMKWQPGILEAEIAGTDPYDPTWSWYSCPASIDLLFGYEELEQWHRVLHCASKIQVDQWF